jgi:hypothetical protein
MAVVAGRIARDCGLLSVDLFEEAYPRGSLHNASRDYRVENRAAGILIDAAEGMHLTSRES